MKKTRVLLTLACAVLLVAASVLGTLAYLTSSESARNTFTVGQVHITLDEARINASGEPVGKEGEVVSELAQAERVRANSYHLLPGHRYTKDPTVTVLKGSEESYVRLLVEVTFETVLSDELLRSTKLDDIFTGYSNDWLRNGTPTARTVTEGQKSYTVLTYEYRYKTTVAAPDADAKLPALFTGIHVPENWTNQTLSAIGRFSIDLTGQAIQADGFSSADDAWAAFPTS